MREELKQKMKNVHCVCSGVAYSLPPSQGKQMCADRMNCRPAFGVVTRLFTRAHTSLCHCVVCIPGGTSGRISTVLQVTATHCQ